MKQPILTRALLLNLLDNCIVNSLHAEPLLGYREIAKQYGCSTAYIVKVAALNGIVRPHGRKPSISSKGVR